MDPKVLEAAAESRWSAIETFFKISDKDGKLVPCRVPDIIQKHLDAAEEIGIFLKGRQQYLTSSSDASIMLELVEEEGINALCLNLDEKKAADNFKRVIGFDKFRHPALRELTHSVKSDNELGYNETRSTVKSLTIKNSSSEKDADLIARSGTYHRVRWTEAAFSRHYKTIKRVLLDTMPRQNRRLIIESTGAGAQGGFYEDFVEVVTYGKPHPTLPNCWVKGKMSAHFIAWFQHHEYYLPESHLNTDSLDPRVRDLLLEDEKDHLAEMQRLGLSPDEIRQRINWRRAVLVDEKNLLTDPVGAIKNMNREYPAKWLHAFQSTGNSWFSTIQIDAKREYWKKLNEDRNLPLRLDFVHVKGAKPEPIAGNRVLLYDVPVLGWKNRYAVIVDPSAGLQDGDPAALGVLDRHLRRYVAVVHGAYSPREIAQLAMDLGAYYDYAKINWENDGNGLGCTEVFIEYGYANLFKNNPDGVTLSDYGWNTNAKTRPIMVANAKTDFEHGNSPIDIPYVAFYGEALAFQCPPGSNRPEAISPAHDDLVMMYALGSVTDRSMALPEKIEKIVMKPGAVSHASISKNLSKIRAAAKRRGAGLVNY